MTQTSQRLQRKPHLIDSHADFFGTDWNGFDKFDPKLYVIDGAKVLRDADFLNSCLANLVSLKWRVIPACKVLSDR